MNTTKNGNKHQIRELLSEAKSALPDLERAHFTNGMRPAAAIRKLIQQAEHFLEEEKRLLAELRVKTE